MDGGVERVDLQDRVRVLEDRLRVLSSSLRAFAEATTDYVRLVDVVAKTLAEVVKDGCVVRLMRSEGWLGPVAIHLPLDHIRDAQMRERVRAHIAAPHNVREQASARRVLETGDPLLIPRLDLEQLRATATPEIVATYEAIGIHSVLLVPLRVRGESIGLLSLARFRAGSVAFDDHDRQLAQSLADHAALAISNARLLKKLETQAAETTAELKVLRGLLPICAWCKRVRDDRGAWAQIESYVAAHTDAVITHGICPECAAGMEPR